MSLVKVRRDGNSLAITIPMKEARKAHLEEGMYVKIEIDEESRSLSIGPVLIQPRLRSEAMDAGRRVLATKRGLYRRLAAYDSGSS